MYINIDQIIYTVIVQAWTVLVPIGSLSGTSRFALVLSTCGGRCSRSGSTRSSSFALSKSTLSISPGGRPSRIQGSDVTIGTWTGSGRSVSLLDNGFHNRSRG